MSKYEGLLYELSAEANYLEEPADQELPHELRLQALWFSGQLGRTFMDQSSDVVEVVQFGEWNHSQGPDFLNTVVRIGTELHRGAIELERSSSDWELHRHHLNSSFDQVVLHVVFVSEGKERFTRTSQNKHVARVVIPDSVWRSALSMPVTDVLPVHIGRCYEPLSEMSDIAVNSLMEEAVMCRMKQKALKKSRVIDALGWDEWLWQSIAQTLGYRANQLQMELLAQRLPVKTLLESVTASESLIYGVAGFLSADLHDHAEGETRGYLRNLWETWWLHRVDYELIPERRLDWSLAAIRPVNHPQRRLAALTKIVSEWKLFSELCRDGGDVVEFFQRMNHPYWSFHYTLKSKRSKRELALVGQNRVVDFQINHLMPDLLAGGDISAWANFKKLPAQVVSSKVRNASLRLFGETPRRKLYLKKAWQHQALIQIYQDFCLQDISDCQQCPFPEQLAQWGK